MLKPCEEWNERLSAYLDGEVDNIERLTVLQHLEACAACRAAAEILRCDAQDVSAALSARGAGEGFAGRVMAQVAVTSMGEPETAPVRQPHPWLDWLVRRDRGKLIALIGVAASAVLLIVVVTMSLGPAGYHNAYQTAAQAPQPIVMSPPAATATIPSGPMADKPAQPGLSPQMPAPTDADSAQVIASGRTSLTPPTPAPEGKSTAEVPRPSSEPTIIPPELNYGLVEKLMIAYTAEMSLRTKTVERSMERAELLFRKYDGFVLNTQYNRDAKGNATATVNGRVPAEKLGQLLVDLDGLGELQARTVNGEDLTAKQLEQIEILGDLALKQQFLSKIEGRDNRYSVESQREAVRSKGIGLRVDEYKLKNRVTLADVTVTISSPPVKKPKLDPVKESAKKSFRGLRAFGTWLLSGILIPLGIWLPVWAPLAILGVVLRRRYRRRSE